MKVVPVIFLSAISLVGLSFGQQPAATSPDAASKEHPFQNSVGMKFVPVPGTKVLFCIHDIIHADYKKYADATPGVDESWKTPNFLGTPMPVGPRQPVVSVSWNDAKAYCAWLSKKEGRAYRLPTDHEWSIAIGIGDKEDPKALAESKNQKITGVYPWGAQWPPPPKFGNFRDEAAKKKLAEFFPKVIEGYDDGFAFTSPIMSFPADKNGLYDMSGNVWQWCEDEYNADPKFGKVMRGGSWTVLNADLCLSSARAYYQATERQSDVGFRVVLVLGSKP